MPHPLHHGEIEQLLKIKTESKNLDYKQGLNWGTCDRDAKVELVKDVLAMANTQDGGRIIFGVRDKDLQLIGLSEEEFASFDQTKINDFLQKYTDPKFACQVYKDTVQNMRFVIIEVAEFLEVPILCKTDAHSCKDAGKQLLRKGQIYIRTDKGTSEGVSSSQEMREVLGRALVKTGDALLGNIERLMKGRPHSVAESSLDSYRVEIEDADTFIGQSIGEELEKCGSWRLCVFPNDYYSNRIVDHKSIKSFMQKSEVDLRGWNVPHTDGENAANFLKGRQSHTSWGRHIEAYRAYQSGLFIWSSVFWEDKEERTLGGKPVMSFVSAIWSLTELLLFVKRYYEQVAPEGDLHLEITLKGTAGRTLVSLKPDVSLSRRYVAHEDVIVLREELQVVSVRASFKEIANSLAQRLFALFNWDDATESTIDHWQAKLLSRSF